MTNMVRQTRSIKYSYCEKNLTFLGLSANILLAFREHFQTIKSECEKSANSAALESTNCHEDDELRLLLFKFESLASKKKHWNKKVSVFVDFYPE